MAGKIFPSYAKPHTTFPGGYSILYADLTLPRSIMNWDGDYGDVLCPSCAESAHAAHPRMILEPFVRWEGPSEECAECGKNLPSEYGDPDESEATN